MRQDGNKIIGNNIKYLRKIFGETQLELAFSIGLNGSSAISQYEHGTRTPKLETIQLISKHYGISERILLNEDITSFKVNGDALKNPAASAALIRATLPIVHSQTALQDSFFKTGYEAHQRIMDAFVNQTDSEADWDIAMDEYEKSYDNNGAPEALANLVWFYIIMEFFAHKPNTVFDSKASSRRKQPFNGLLKKYYLTDCDMPQEYDDEFSDQDRQDLRDIVMDSLKDLKHIPEYAELADYYIALRYVQGFANPQLELPASRDIGTEMFRCLLELENQYAKKFFATSIKILKK